ncbi:MAG: Na(+)-translocating NADH-quinone reductase subunit A [Bacteroidales bacterium]
MQGTITIKKGFDIRLKGKPEPITDPLRTAEFIAIKPTDFKNINPKLIVKEGDTVKAGDELFFDKSNTKIKFVSPVSGVIYQIVRGERRVLEKIIIRADRTNIHYKQFQVPGLSELNREQTIELLLESGLWTYIIQRPYGIIANPDDTPKAIFVSGFDTSPLAPDYNYIIAEEKEQFQLGLNVLRKLTNGKVHLGIQEGNNNNFVTLQNVEINTFRGPHPAGNVGIQIHHINPINKGEKVWTVSPQDVLIIGRFFEKGIVDFIRTISLVGPAVTKPQYYKTLSGTSIAHITTNRIDTNNTRIISGNPLTGVKVTNDDFLGYYHNQVTVLYEGNEAMFMGWAEPGLKRYSMLRTFLSSVLNKDFNINTNMNGGPRAFVVTGLYEQVLPMDILPLQLFKAILANDIDKMEQLGLYEVLEEDLALCEFVCPSKTEIQALIRKGLEVLRTEIG